MTPVFPSFRAITWVWEVRTQGQDAEGIVTKDELGEEIERCNPQIQSLADCWVKQYRQLDREDVVQEIMLAFVMANQTYRPELALATFSTFALEHANWRILDYARNELGRGVKVPKDLPLFTIDMEDLNRVVTADGAQLHETLAAPSGANEPVVDETLWEKLKPILTARQYEALELSVRDDLDRKDIAERMGISEESVTQMVRRARDRIRDFMPHLGALVQRRVAS